MTRKRTRRRVVAAVSLAITLIAATSAAATAGQTYESEGLRLVRTFSFTGGSEITAAGGLVYANQIDGETARGQYPDQGGMRIYDLEGGAPSEIGSLDCAGNDNDVQIASNGYAVIAHHTNRCNPGGHGLLVVDVSPPARPRVVGRVLLPPGASSHTVTPHPERPLVYVSPGGLFNGAGRQHIVDLASPSNPRTIGSFEPGRAGCHDLTLQHVGRRLLGFCAGFGETTIWDFADPVEPDLVSRIYNPLTQLMYVALPSPDGAVLAVVDEAFVAHSCSASPAEVVGGVWLYDITVPEAPVLRGVIGPPRGGAPVATVTDITTWCAAHGIAWRPGRGHDLAITWYSGGISVYDVADPLGPVEKAYFQASDSLAEAVVFVGPFLVSNDLRRGVDVFRLQGVRPGR